MKNLIILNYQREIPPYLISEINFAKKHFDTVYYFTPIFHNDNSNTVSGENITINQIKKVQKYISLVRAFLILLRKEFVIDIFKATKEKKVSFRFVKHLLSEFVCSDMLFRAVKPLLENKEKDNSYIILASWFGVEAYAAARLKKRFPAIKGYSFAHAFEIKPEVNQYVSISLNDYKQNYLDRIYFISKKMRDTYHKATQDQFAKYDYKESIRYLGSLKKIEGLNPINTCDYHIVSCASVIELKRLDLILNSLSFATDYKITWTHIGDGPMLAQLKKEASILVDKHPNVKIEFLGNLSNYDVQKYYAEVPIDLFISASRSEGLPVSIMEALSFGIPVLATDTGGTCEVVDNEVGLLIPINISPRELYYYIDSLLVLDESEIELLRKHAYDKWRQHFNQVENAAEFYNEL